MSEDVERLTDDEASSVFAELMSSAEANPRKPRGFGSLDSARSDSDITAEVIRLRKAGMIFSDIANRVGWPQSRVYKIARHVAVDSDPEPVKYATSIPPAGVSPHAWIAGRHPVSVRIDWFRSTSGGGKAHAFAGSDQFCGTRIPGTTLADGTPKCANCGREVSLFRLLKAPPQDTVRVDKIARYVGATDVQPKTTGDVLWLSIPPDSSARRVHAIVSPDTKSVCGQVRWAEVDNYVRHYVNPDGWPASGHVCNVCRRHVASLRGDSVPSEHVSLAAESQPSKTDEDEDPWARMTRLCRFAAEHGFTFDDPSMGAPTPLPTAPVPTPPAYAQPSAVAALERARANNPIAPTPVPTVPATPPPTPVSTRPPDKDRRARIMLIKSALRGLSGGEACDVATDAVREILDADQQEWDGGGLPF